MLRGDLPSPSPPSIPEIEETPNPLKESSAMEKLYTLLESRELREEEVTNWSSEEIQNAINLMLARHGYPFTGNRFRGEDWFAPVEGRTISDVEQMFSSVEKHNWKLLTQQRSKNRQQNQI
ncbi:MAG: hypothetical protein F6J86_09140 [Symploca sp. SIO1B1]|nr:hypothetical protein [Symploca sp. SIO1B1]